MSRTKWNLVLVMALVLATAGCTNDALDDGDGADVIVEIVLLDNPPVSGSLDLLTGLCTFEITQWNLSARAEPKNVFAEPPFNDVTMMSVEIQYNWLNPATSTPTRDIGLGGATIPVGGTATITFEPITFDDLLAAIQSNPALASQGGTAGLVMTFHARTIEGTNIFVTVTRSLNIEACA